MRPSRCAAKLIALTGVSQGLQQLLEVVEYFCPTRHHKRQRLCGNVSECGMPLPSLLRGASHRGRTLPVSQPLHQLPVILVMTFQGAGFKLHGLGSWFGYQRPTSLYLIPAVEISWGTQVTIRGFEMRAALQGFWNLVPQS